MHWIIGDGDQFGEFALCENGYQSKGEGSGITIGYGFHFLAGPEQTDMPPRLYDFRIGYQRRAFVGDFGYDISIAVLAASDFEGSSRDGIRFPSHAVGYWRVNESIDLVFGADYLDRDDIGILPVGGLVWRPGPDFRLDLVFPDPRAFVQLSDSCRLFLHGGFGGGTWAVERVTEADDLATYFDLRIGIGLEHSDDDGDWHAAEIAYLFDRKLEYASGRGDYRPNGTVMIRSVITY
jgi:hypothetical protein